MSRLHADYGQIIIAVLEQAWKIYGPFTQKNQKEVAAWVQKQVNEIRDGHSTHEPEMTNAMREFPRT